MKSLILKASRSLDLFFPPFCLHCNKRISNSKAPFCRTCISLFILLDPFLFKNNVAAAFDSMGPPLTFYRELKAKRFPSFIKVAASYLVYQLCNLKWPFYELIVTSKNRLGDERLMAKEMAHIINRPYCLRAKGRPLLIIYDRIKIEDFEDENLIYRLGLMRS